MAVWSFECFYGATQAWTDVAANNLAFAGSGGFDDTVEIATYQDQTHVVSGTPGSDVCTTNHCNNVKWITTSTMSVNGGGAEDITDVNLAEAECTARWHFNHTSAIAMQNMTLFAYDGSVEANEAVEVHIMAFERGVSATAWTVLNDDSGNIGGSAYTMALGAKATPATDHYFYLALSWSPETAGAKTAQRLKIQGEYY